MNDKYKMIIFTETNFWLNPFHFFGMTLKLITVDSSSYWIIYSHEKCWKVIVNEKLKQKSLNNEHILKTTINIYIKLKIFW